MAYPFKSSLIWLLALVPVCSPSDPLIIALGIFKKGWSVIQATEKFERLVGKAFSTRSLLGPPSKNSGSPFQRPTPLYLSVRER
jgi:hypothetical protein